MRELKDVIAFYSVAGAAYVLLQVVATDLDTYAEFAMTVIRRLPGIKEMNTMFVLKDIKATSTHALVAHESTSLRMDFLPG